MSLTSLPVASMVLPTALPTHGSIYASNLAAFQRENATFIFTPDVFTLDPLLGGFTTDALYIYAETIRLAGAYSYPGKTIGLYCDTLDLNGNVTVDVSGTHGNNGVPAAAAASGGGKQATDGAPGQDGGTIELFVQNGVERQLQSIEMLANGGNGGNGGDVEDDTALRLGRGGRGGDGATDIKAGSIIVQYGSTASRLGVMLVKAMAGD
ncbi:hypothetical protein ANO11243_092630 [Dothideomycetidae sp. 11243]|nr:hypothetical protein ANO11243_092630 [fungal sp. No.11243]